MGSAAALGPYRRFESCEKKICLTFDDGPDKRNTPEILDVLSEYGVKATFFVIGSNAEGNLPLLRRELEEGHEIGNHTYSHPHLKGITEEALRGEILKTENILFRLEEYRPRLFRPPEGVYSGTVAKTLEELDYLPILWTVDTQDWRHLSAQKIADTVLRNTKPGSIILCHDYISGKGHTAEALKIFLPELKKQGYTFVTVSEMIPPDPANGE